MKINRLITIFIIFTTLTLHSSLGVRGQDDDYEINNARTPEEKIEQLTRRTKRLSERLRTVENQGLPQKFSSLEKQLHELYEENKQLRYGLKQEVEQLLREEGRDSNQQFLGLEERLVKTQKDLGNILTTRNQLIEQVKSNETYIDSVRAQAEIATEEAAQLKTELNQCKVYAAEQAQELTTLKNEVKRINELMATEIAALKEEIRILKEPKKRAAPPRR